MPGFTRVGFKTFADGRGVSPPVRSEIRGMETARTVPTGTGRRRVRVAALVEHLEARRLLCGARFGRLGRAKPRQPGSSRDRGRCDTSDTVRAAAARSESAPIPPAGLPRLHTASPRPGGRLPRPPTASAAYAPYDTDGDPSTFGPAEQAAIAEAWRQVASYFSMLNLDVTTEPPSVPYSYSLISNSVTSGQNLGNFPWPCRPISTPPRTRPTARPRSARDRPQLGPGAPERLRPQGGEDGRVSPPGTTGCTGRLWAWTMHKTCTSGSSATPCASPLLLQDDLAVMAATLKPYAGGDGSRPDDVPGDLPHARLVAAGGGGPSASGIIERLSDRDAFLFRSPGGGVTLDVVPPDPRCSTRRWRCTPPTGR